MVMNDEFGRSQMMRSYLSSFLEKLRKTTKNLSFGSWPSGSETTLEFPEYELGIAAAHPRRLVMLDVAEVYFNADLLLVSKLKRSHESLTNP
jgi:hypothetical protein